MIVNCNNCNKKFSVKDSLVSEKGRLLECGNCQNRWFFNPINKPSIDVNNSDVNIQIQKSDIKEVDVSNIIINENHSEEVVHDINIKKKNTKSFGKSKKEINKNAEKNLLKKYLINFTIILITFFAMIIVIDTFKVSISSILPGILPLLANLYATLLDLYLFIKDLFN